MSAGDLSLSVCGIDCTECQIRHAMNDPAQAEELAPQFGTTPDHICCSGCRGERTSDKHFHASCYLLSCCVDRKHLENCSQCDEFPCEAIENFAADGPKYAAAVDRLRKLRRS